MQRATSSSVPAATGRSPAGDGDVALDFSGASLFASFVWTNVQAGSGRVAATSRGA